MTFDDLAVLMLVVFVVVKLSWRIFLARLYIGNQMRWRKVMDQRLEESPRARRRG